MTRLILKHLLTNDDYTAKVYPFLKKRYFDDSDEITIFKGIEKYFGKYNSFPNLQEMEVLVSKTSDDEDRARLLKLVSKIKSEPELPDGKFLFDETEEYIRNKDLQLSILDSVEIIQKGNKTETAGIPSLIESSLAISFDKTIGLNYAATASERLEYYRKVNSSGFKCDLDIINRLTNQGFKRKTLTTLVAQPHLGRCRPGSEKIEVFGNDELIEELKNFISKKYAAAQQKK